MSAHVVQLFVYDLSKGLAANYSRDILGTHLEAVWHSSVVVYEREYLYGSHGISNTKPYESGIGRPNEVISIGMTQLPQEIFHEYLTGLNKTTFAGERYHILQHNCNNFSDAACQFLTGNGIPENILRLPQEFANSPVGRMLLPIIEMTLGTFSAAGLSFAGPASSSSNADDQQKRKEDDPKPNGGR